MAITSRALREIAAHFRKHRPDSDPDVDGDQIEPRMLWNDLVVGTAEILATENPRFDQVRFYQAAGYGD